MVTQAGQAKRALSRTRAGLVGLPRGGARRLIPGRERGAERQGRGARRCRAGRPEPRAGAGSWGVLDARSLRSRDRDQAAHPRSLRHAHTLWYVIFNSPENCSDAACDDDDIIIDPSDHSAGFNAPQIAATRASVARGSAGAVTNPAGRLKLDGALGAGELPHAPRQVVIGRGEDGALVPLGVVTGLEDPHGAVIIAVLQDHGAAHDEPELLERQLTSFQGACNPGCEDVQTARELPGCE
jgi:hypothetical protein